MSRVDGFTEQDGVLTYHTLYAYGGRSFTMHHLAADGTLSFHWDSQDDVGRQMAQHLPDIFNTNKNPDRSPEGAFDRRSDDKVFTGKRDIKILTGQSYNNVLSVLSN